MEEILASIRRIIADDQSLPGRPAADTHAPETASEPSRLSGGAPHESPAAPQDAPHILRTPRPEDAMARDMADAGPDETDAHLRGHDVIAPQFEQPDVPAWAPTPAATATGASENKNAFASAPAVATGPRLDATASLDQKHESLDQGEPAPADRIFSAAVESSVTTAFNTLAASRLIANSDELMGLVREMVRPLLKAWLDDHLPVVIEQLVSAEIGRITRSGL